MKIYKILQNEYFTSVIYTIGIKIGRKENDISITPYYVVYWF